jgi:myo-inositol-1(or 4)-monophosphatase
MSINLPSLHSQILPLIQEAERIALDHFEGELEVSYKPDETSRVSIVTQVDMQIDELFRQGLGELFPEAGFITEEHQPTEAREYTWVIDPIDGTTNYSRGMPFFGISVGLWQGNQPVYGCISLPVLNQRVHGYLGGGVWLNDQAFKLKPQTISPKPYVILAPVTQPAELGALAERISQDLNHHRDFGSSVYQAVQVVTGKADILISYHVALWDIGASVLLAQEAGLKLTWMTPPPSLSQPAPKDYIHSVIFGQPELVDRAVLALTDIMKS